MDNNRKIGYARVSSKEQNLDRQILALKDFVDESNIIVDKQSGRNLDRQGYQALKGPMGLRTGDTLYIKSLDRLRSKFLIFNQQVNLVEKVKKFIVECMCLINLRLRR